MAKKIEFYEGKPVFQASNSKKLAEAVAKYEGEVEPPYVVRIPNRTIEVKSEAFWDDKTVGVVLISDTVKCIEGSAFGKCTNLSVINIPASVIIIEEHAFRSESLISIKVSPDNPVYDSREDCNAIIETSSNNLILGCANTIIPDTVTCIGNCDYGAFEGNKGLKEITIPDSVKSIGARTFKGCSALTNIQIPDSVTSIGYSAFEGCSALTNIQIPDSVTSIGYSAFGGCSALTNIQIPDSVTSIGSYVFQKCTGLTNIQIPDTVSEIGDRAFWGCTNLFSVRIPNSVTKIENIAFLGCAHLSNINVSPDNPVYDSREDCNAIIETASNQLVLGFKNTIIPDSVTSIGDYAFLGCTSLTEITIPDSVTSIGDEVFYGCTSLASIIIPDSVTSIGSEAFHNCTGLTSVRISNSLTSIGYELFKECENLTTIQIPNSVKTIGYGAFGFCKSLVSVHIPDSVVYIDDAFYGCTGLKVIHISDARLLKGAGIGKGVKIIGSKSVKKQKLPDTLEGKPVFLASNSKNLVEAVLKYKRYGGVAEPPYVVGISPRSTEIKENAFKNDETVGVVLMSDSIRIIGYDAFRNCKNLTRIHISELVSFIDYRAFDGCPNIAEIIVAPDNKTFDSREDCNAIIETASNKLVRGCKNTVIPDSVNTIDYCSSRLTTIEIPNSVTRINEYAFGGSYNIAKIIVAPDNKTFDSREDCNAIIETASNELILGCKNTVIPNSVISIGKGAFWYCDLKSITIPDSVTKIGDHAFEYSCLKEITISDSVTEIGIEAFSRCEDLKEITIPASVKLIDERAFSYCDLKKVYFKGTDIKVHKDTFIWCGHLKEIHIKNPELLKDLKLQPKVKIITD